MLLCRRCGSEPVPSEFALCAACLELVRYRAQMGRELERERDAPVELELELARQMTLDELER